VVSGRQEADWSVLFGSEPEGSDLYHLSVMAFLFKRRRSVQVLRYRGTSIGWQAIGTRRTEAAAARFLATWARIDPCATLRAVEA